MTSEVVHTCNFIKKRLEHRCFPMNFAKFLRTPILKNISDCFYALLASLNFTAGRSAEQILL